MFSKFLLFFINTILSLCFTFLFNINAQAYETSQAMKDLSSLGLAYSTHIFVHELGHQVVADDMGAEDHNISFLTKRNG